MAIFKNKSKTEPVKSREGRVILDPGQQLTVHPPYNNDINDALDAGTAELIDDTPTPAELQADVDAINEGVEAMDKIVKGD